MKNLVLKKAFLFSCLVLMLSRSYAASNITSDLCVSIETGIEIGVSGSPGAEVHVEGGAGWEIAFVGQAAGSVTAGVAAEVNAANSVSLGVDLCVNAEDLIVMYQADLLTPLQRDQVVLFLGQNAVNDQQAEEAQSGLLSAANVNGLQVKRTAAVLQPIATNMDLMVRTMTGELSLIDMMDESIYAVESLANALPMEPTLARFMVKFGEDMGNKLVDVQRGMEKICTSIAGDGTPIGAVCENVVNVEKGAETLQNNVRKVVDFGGTIAGQVKQLGKVIDGVSTAMVKVDEAMGATIGKLDGVIQTVGSTTRQVVELTTNTKRILGGMTSTIDGAVNVTNAGIGSIQDVVITPLELASKASKSTIDAILTVLGAINSQLGLVTSAMEGEV